MEEEDFEEMSPSEGGSQKKRRRNFRDVHILPVVAVWLQANYRGDPEGSIPKDGIFQEYMALCAEHNLTPAKNNIFSKMLKKIFPGVRSRRLGPRGRGIPHYGGLSPLDESERSELSYLLAVAPEATSMSSTSQPNANGLDLSQLNMPTASSSSSPGSARSRRPGQPSEGKIRRTESDPVPKSQPFLNGGVEPAPLVPQLHPIPMQPLPYHPPLSIAVYNPTISRTPSPSQHEQMWPTDQDRWHVKQEQVPALYHDNSIYYHSFDPPTTIYEDTIGIPSFGGPLKQELGDFAPLDPSAYHPFIYHTHPLAPNHTKPFYDPDSPGADSHSHHHYDISADFVTTSSTNSPNHYSPLTSPHQNGVSSFVSVCERCDPAAIAAHIMEFEDQYFLPRYLSRIPISELPTASSPPPLLWPELPKRDSELCLHKDVEEVLGLMVYADDLAWRLRSADSSAYVDEHHGVENEEEKESDRDELSELKDRLEARYQIVSQAVRHLGWGAGGLVHLWLVSILAFAQDALRDRHTALRTASLAVKVLTEWHHRPGFVVGAGSLAVLEPLVALLMTEPTYHLELAHLLSMLHSQSPQNPVGQGHLRRFHQKWNARFFVG